MNAPIELPSGAQLALFVASFEEANALKKAVAREIAKAEINLSGTQELTELTPQDFNSLKGVVFQLLGSDTVEAALMACMKRCTYNGQRIDAKTFQPEEAREDYHVIAWEVMVLNLTPFFKSLLSLLPKKAAVETKDEDQKSG